jgi:predicted DNA-binding protein (MmcQ/YjbR family)
MTSRTAHRYFQALYDTCAAKPMAEEDHPWGETVFKVGGKVFAFLGHGERAGVTVKAAPDEIDSLLALPYVKRSAYIGRFGWVSVAITDEDTLDLALRLVDRSYDLIVAKLPRKKQPGGGGAKKGPA